MSGDIRELTIHPEEKGFGGPAHTAGVTSAELLAAGVGVEDGWLSSPRALLDEPALRHNVDAMAKLCADTGVALYPHGKTTMSPQLVARQLAAGAGGVTVANVRQARLFRRFGVADVLIANEVTDEASISWLAESLDSEATTLVYVDSVDGVDLLDRGLRRAGAAQRLPVLVELAHEDGRSGAADRPTALAVAGAVNASSHLTLRGVAGYEGSITGTTPEAITVLARTYCERLGELAAELVGLGYFEDVPIVTAGGSAYFDAVLATLAGRDEWRLVLRSGCYLTHDNGLYARVSPSNRTSAAPRFRPALEVRAHVVSRPTPDRAVIGCGRRDVSSDAGLPVLLRAWSADGEELPTAGVEPRTLFDQHLVVSVPTASPLRPGDEVALGVSHPCTTFDKWRWLPVVDAGRIVDVVRTFF